MQNSIDLILDRLTLHFVADPPNFQFKAIVFISRLHPVATILKQLLLVLLAVQVDDVVSIFAEFQFWFDITDIILDNFFKCQVLKFLSVATLDLFCFYYVMKNYRGLWHISARLLVTTILKSPQRLSISKWTSLVNLLASEKLIILNCKGWVLCSHEVRNYHSPNDELKLVLTCSCRPNPF